MENTYMDDIIDNVSDKRKALSTTRDIERLISKGGFKIDRARKVAWVWRVVGFI